MRTSPAASASGVRGIDIRPGRLDHPPPFLSGGNPSGKELAAGHMAFPVELQGELNDAGLDRVGVQLAEVAAKAQCAGHAGGLRARVWLLAPSSAALPAPGPGRLAIAALVLAPKRRAMMESHTPGAVRLR